MKCELQKKIGMGGGGRGRGRGYGLSSTSVQNAARHVIWLLGQKLGQRKGKHEKRRAEQ